MDLIAFRAVLRSAEKTVPTNERAKIKINQFWLELSIFAEKRDKFHTLEEWKQFRKDMRNGARLAKCFGDKREKPFRVMMDTATSYIRGSERDTRILSSTVRT
jgi:hypothetical protein